MEYVKLRHRQKSLKPKNVIIVTTPSEWEDAYLLFKKTFNYLGVIGFDCEWTMHTPVSLVQITNYDGLCLLFRIGSYYHNSQRLPASFVDLLSDRKVLKTGVDLKKDAQRLKDHFNLVVWGCVDLRSLLLRVNFPSVLPRGLSYLGKELLGIEVPKDYFLRCGDWDAHTLSSAQIHYAAMDSLVAMELFKKLICFGMKSLLAFDGHQLFTDTGYRFPPTQFIWLAGEGVYEGWQGSCVDQEFDVAHYSTVVKDLCLGIIDTGFKESSLTKKLSNNDQATHHISASPLKPPLLDDHKTSLCPSLQSRKTPLYDNCVLLDPSGEPLTTCDSRKAKWYLRKGLAEVESQEPLKVRLLFQPAGAPLETGGYYLQAKDNVCVVCGATDNYHRKNIIPREYRKHFPSLFKDHKSHDVILLCTPCHQLSSHHDSLLKHSLAILHHAPIRSDKYHQSSFFPKVKSAAKALRGAHKVPVERRTELLTVLREFYEQENGVEEGREGMKKEKEEEEKNEVEEAKEEKEVGKNEQLEEREEEEEDEEEEKTEKEKAEEEEDEDKLVQFALNFQNCKSLNPSYEEHGRIVVASVSKEEEGLIEFERMWRQHFVDTMRPQHLPKLWSVHHCHQVLKTLL